MAKKHADKNKTVAKASAKPVNTLQSLFTKSAAICILVVSVCFCFLALVERPAISERSIEAQAQSLANSQVSLVDQALTQLRLRLSSLAATPELITAVNADDQEALSRFQQELNRAFPEAVSAKLIILGPLGIAALHNDQYQLRNAIEVDLLRYVSNGDNVEPEAYKFEGRWLFSLAEPIKTADAKFAGGAILVTLDEKYLQTLLGQLDSAFGQTSLIQQFKNKQHLIASAGNPGEERFRVSADASISQWQVFFTPSAEMIANSSHSAILIWAMLAISAVVGLLAFLLALTGLQKSLQTNLAKLAGGEKTNYTLPGFETVAKDLSAKLTKATKANADASKSTVATVDSKPAVANPAPAKAGGIDIPKDIPETIFRAYDIRGLADQQLNDGVVYAIGLAIGSEALDQGQQSLIVAADGRHSSPRIHDALIRGLMDSGRDVIDIGTVPTPLMYFATQQLGTQSGVMITGSHNPADYNGLKIVLAGHALSGPAIQALRQRIVTKDLATGKGQLHNQEIEQSYIDYIINDVAIAQPLKIVIDAGNGVAGAIAPRLFEELGCEIIPLYCDVDGNFPNHHPDPTVEANLADLKKVVAQHKADLGIAFDGDGDRLGVVTASGKFVPADRLLMLLAQDVVSRNPGADVLFDVKCTRNLNTLISNYGGRPIMWKSGHSFMKEKMLETGALLGGEFSGHIFFKERWFGFDDGMYAAARLIEILSTSDPDLDLQLEAFPESISTPELKVETSEDAKFSTVDQLISRGNFGEGKLSTLDGVRVDYPDGWGLVRASNTTPMLILRFEADTEQAMSRIQTQFKDQLLGVDPSLQIGF